MQWITVVFNFVFIFSLAKFYRMIFDNVFEQECVKFSPTKDTFRCDQTYPFLFLSQYIWYSSEMSLSLPDVAKRFPLFFLLIHVVSPVAQLFCNFIGNKPLNKLYSAFVFYSSAGFVDQRAPTNRTINEIIFVPHEADKFSSPENVAEGFSTIFDQ